MGRRASEERKPCAAFVVSRDVQVPALQSGCLFPRGKSRCRPAAHATWGNTSPRLLLFIMVLTAAGAMDTCELLAVNSVRSLFWK